MSEPLATLIPCPYCGHRHPMLVSLDAFASRYAVICVSCNASVSADTAQEAEALWNTRADKSIQVLEQQIMGLKVMINMGLSWEDVLEPISGEGKTKH